jgi:hypothetical protein
LARSRWLGDNAGMARDDSGGRSLRRLIFMSALDGTRPAGISEWVSPVAPAVAQAAIGAGHWAAGRRQRALAAWTGAAGFGLVAWGLGTEAPTRAEAQQYIEQQKDLMRERGLKVPATAWTQAPTPSLRHGLRHPRRLTVGAIADQAWTVVFFGLRLPRAVQRRRPRISVGSVLVVAGSVAGLRAASAEPLR